ncbi:MAG TPA: nitroreductase family deazaflavin-dependent oxidoreductase [Actinomycetota bacterium]|jgi:deazaflavin-dependent oxidoreductase (nitroreductase family)
MRNRRALGLLWKVHRFTWRVSGGRIGTRVAGLPILELITTGRRSGQPRSVLLNYLDDPAGYAVIASNAGSSSPPAWWRNLEATPTAVVRRRGRRQPVTPRVLEGEARERVWSAAVAANGDYATYAEEAGRPIPVVLLEPTGFSP